MKMNEKRVAHLMPLALGEELIKTLQVIGFNTRLEQSNKTQTPSCYVYASWLDHQVMSKRKVTRAWRNLSMDDKQKLESDIGRHLLTHPIHDEVFTPDVPYISLYITKYFSESRDNRPFLTKLRDQFFTATFQMSSENKEKLSQVLSGGTVMFGGFPSRKGDWKLISVYHDSAFARVKYEELLYDFPNSQWKLVQGTVNGEDVDDWAVYRLGGI